MIVPRKPGIYPVTLSSGDNDCCLWDGEQFRYWSDGWDPVSDINCTVVQWCMPGRCLNDDTVPAHPAPTPQRTDAGGVAVLFKIGDRVRVTEGERVGVTGRITGISSNGIITVNEGLVGMPQHFAYVQDPPAVATSPSVAAAPTGVDEGMRERVLAVLRKDMPGEYSRMVRLSDDICAAILASHEIMRRLQ